MKDTYLKDLINYVDSIPYGEISVILRKKDRRVTEVTTAGAETLRFRAEDNYDPMEYLNKILDNISTSGYSGEVTLKLDYKDGRIGILTIYDKKQTKY